MEQNVKVSIVVPIYNVEKYLRQCLDSIKNQTLKEIEVICVNDGSTDKSSEIIQEYVNKDSRFKVINKPNTGYGNSMNCGFDLAAGEYVGIVESDDYADSDMFEKLYDIAHNNDLDAVKSGFYYYYSVPKEKNVKEIISSPAMENRTLCPRDDFKSPKEMVEFFNIKPSIWSAIYNLDFIRKNNIRFNETPGASFQDSGFNFKVWASADRVQLTSGTYLHYRQDNENSSVNSGGKVFCVCDEYQEMENFLDKNPVYKAKLECLKNRLKYDTYMWNYDRLSSKFKFIFIERASQELKEDLLKGNLDEKYFEWYKWEDLIKLIEDPVTYHTQKSIGKQMIYLKKEEYDRIIQSKSYKIIKGLNKAINKFKGGVLCCKDHGVFYTLIYSFRKIIRRLMKRARNEY